MRRLAAARSTAADGGASFAARDKLRHAILHIGGEKIAQRVGQLSCVRSSTIARRAGFNRGRRAASRFGSDNGVLVLGDMSERVPHEMNAAALPGGSDLWVAALRPS